MTDDEFIEREYFEVAPELLQHREALRLEDKFHPDEEPGERSQRLLRESLPLVLNEAFELSRTARDPDVRQDAKTFLSGLILWLVQDRRERTN